MSSRLKRFRPRAVGVAAVTVLSGLAPLSAGVSAAADSAASQCEALAARTTSARNITKATFVTQPMTAARARASAGGAREPVPSDGGEMTSAAFCRVEVTTTPVPGAEIKTEVWLPEKSKWNGRMLGTGNGGPAGAINYGALVGGLAMGYAVSNTDVGTHVALGTATGGDSFKFGFDPELRTNYVWRGIHEMTEAAKEAIHAYYGKPADKALFAGCSTGGGEAAAEVQRFPEDYDGILMGSPAIYWGQLGLFQGWSYAATHQTPAHRIGREKLPAIEAEVLKQCDELDKVKDGVIENPRACKFNAATLACKGAENDRCLTGQQIEAVSKIYAGLRNPRTKELIYYGLQPGVESAVAARVRISNEDIGSVVNPTMVGPLAWVLPRDWKADDWLTFDWDKGSADLLKKVAPYSNDNPDIRPFANRGGKLIMWAGWGDPNFPEFNTARYYEEAQKAVGAKASDSLRLYLAPGVAHCGGGPGPNQLGQNPSAYEMSPDRNLIVALDQWVSKGIAPKAIIATKFVDNDTKKAIERTRPVCAYPEIAQWNGVGSTNDHKNFACVTAEQ